MQSWRLYHQTSNNYKNLYIKTFQGEAGDTFYFIEEGEAVATKKETPNGEEKEVYHYSPGGYFGELALRTNAPRQASVKAKVENIKL